MCYDLSDLESLILIRIIQMEHTPSFSQWRFSELVHLECDEHTNQGHPDKILSQFLKLANHRSGPVQNTSQTIFPKDIKYE